MNKKLKKILATVSAVAMCAVSMTTMVSNASVVSVPKSDKPTEYWEGNVCYTLLDIPLNATSFNTYEDKYVLWEDATEYAKLSQKDVIGITDIKIYKRENSDGTGFEDIIAYIKSHAYHVIGCGDQLYGTWGLSYTGAFGAILNEEEADTVRAYLDSKNIEYSEYRGETDPKDTTRIEINDADIRFSTCLDVLENTGIYLYYMNFMESIVSVKSAEVPLPEPTLSGDANEDGDVNMADAVLIMQTLSNPDEYKLTLQGMANADIAGDGDGVTAMDALTIQLSIINQ